AIRGFRLAAREPGEVDILAAKRPQEREVETLRFLLLQHETAVAKPGDDPTGQNVFIPEIGVIAVKFLNPGKDQGAAVVLRGVRAVGDEMAQPGKLMQLAIPRKRHAFNSPRILVVLLMRDAGEIEVTLKDMIGALGIAGKHVAGREVEPLRHAAFQKRLIGPARIEEIGEQSPRWEAVFCRGYRGFIHFRPSIALMLAA